MKGTICFFALWSCFSLGCAREGKPQQRMDAAEQVVRIDRLVQHVAVRLRTNDRNGR